MPYDVCALSKAGGFVICGLEEDSLFPGGSKITLFTRRKLLNCTITFQEGPRLC